MSNKYRIPVDVEHRIRTRDIRCVYCAKEFSADSRRDIATIEHLNERPPFRWHEGLKEEGLAICCGGCNSSRTDKSLPDWFPTPYCTDRPIPICADSVAEPVKRYLRSSG